MFIVVTVVVVDGTADSNFCHCSYVRCYDIAIVVVVIIIVVVIILIILRLFQ